MHMTDVEDIQSTIIQVSVENQLDNPFQACNVTGSKIMNALATKWNAKLQGVSLNQPRQYQFNNHERQLLMNSRIFLLTFKWNRPGQTFGNHIVVFYPQEIDSVKSWVLAHSWQNKLALKQWIKKPVKQIAHEFITRTGRFQSLIFQVDLFKSPILYFVLYVLNAESWIGVNLGIPHENKSFNTAFEMTNQFLEHKGFFLLQNYFYIAKQQVNNVQTKVQEGESGWRCDIM